MTATPRNKSMIQKLYDWTMEKSAHPHAEYWLALVSFIEASFFPIPPHPMLGLMCLRSEEHTSELQSLMRISYADFCSKKQTTTTTNKKHKTDRYMHVNTK